ncbi:hypothetical protein C8A05DRAFT_35594 [Staphylotrichum tortipilum]|uniref:Uncharacterized protein n=1 Tax=Staphylotrichum tortipilum TaxID=2831512 RepID=A0AAN6MHM3_9PEZI|nr:hypothetical protein C8A05DRAFT_35594 [Staphylotrichum longicolle]
MMRAIRRGIDNVEELERVEREEAAALAALGPPAAPATLLSSDADLAPFWDPVYPKLRASTPTSGTWTRLRRRFVSPIAANSSPHALIRESLSTTTTIMNLNTATIPLRPSPALDVGLTPKQKARLHEVADLLLEIYQTLARMRRIEAAWIQPSPHDLTAHLPLYASLGLDPRVIYLYSIVPCLDPLAASTSSARFFESCGFFDPRNEEHVREAREFHRDCAVSEDDPGCELRPWTTALSQTGQYAAIVMYEARRHVVFFLDNTSYENNDRNLWNGDEWSVSEGEDEEDEEEEEGEEEEEEEEEEEADEKPYHEEWWGHDDALRAVYRNHGWPGENFDGDAFVVDRARVIPAAKIRFEPEEALPSRLEQLQYMVRESEEAEKAATAQGHEKLVAANDVDEDWVARWEIWNAKQLTRESTDRLMRAKELVARGRGRQKVEDLPFWEWDQVRRDLEYAQLSLGRLKQGLEDAGTSALPPS